MGYLNNCLENNIIFLALPTLFSFENNEYNKDAIHETLLFLEDNNYLGSVVIKSTVEPETIDKLNLKYNLNIIHNPEFLTARTAFHDFHNQKHIVLGKSKLCSQNCYENVCLFYKKYYPNAEISCCSALESESMKSFLNCFYATKVQFFNELYLLCQSNGSNFNTIKNLMLKNNWINPMHTNVPGPDGKLSYGGACFPKDTNALSSYMKKLNTPNKVLSSVIEERNSIRN